MCIIKQIWSYIQSKTLTVILDQLIAGTKKTDMSKPLQPPVLLFDITLYEDFSDNMVRLEKFDL